ncbi:MAG: hypothetical protein P1V19_07070 [Gimesia sp.]|nr:hypothetical protein [Gimesia sp.]
MTVLNQLNHELTQLTGFHSAQPRTVTLAATGKIEVMFVSGNPSQRACAGTDGI